MYEHGCMISIILSALLLLVLLTNLLGLWIAMLLSLGATCSLLCNDNHEVRIKYLLVQEIFTWMVFWSLLTSSLRFFVLSANQSGIPPMHGWFIRILDHANSSTIWIISVGKAPTLLVLTWCQLSTFFVLSLISSLILLVWVTQLKPLMIFSSGVNIIWGVIGCSGSLLTGWTFLVAYLSYLWLFFELWSQAGLIAWTSLLGLTGLPPSAFFFLKSLLVLWISGDSFVLLMLFIMRTIILFSAYLSWLDAWSNKIVNIFTMNHTVITASLQISVGGMVLAFSFFVYHYHSSSSSSFY